MLLVASSAVTVILKDDPAVAVPDEATEKWVAGAGATVRVALAVRPVPPSVDVIAPVTFEDHRFDALKIQEVGECQTSRTCPDNSNLSAHQLVASRFKSNGQLSSCSIQPRGVEWHVTGEGYSVRSCDSRTLSRVI